MAKKRFHHSGSYEGRDERRKQEHLDSQMLSEDMSAIANMPQMVKYHAWGMAPYASHAQLDDTKHGIDHQIHEDEKKHKSGTLPEKY